MFQSARWYVYKYAYIVHSKLDYCNSVYYSIPKSEINRLQ